MSTRMARDTARVSTQSWGLFVGCCNLAWFTWAADKKLHTRGTTRPQAICQLELLPRYRGEDVLG
jgi:hypothetical protein